MAGKYIDRWRESLINGRLYQTTTNTDQTKPANRWYADPFLDRDKMGLASDQVALASVWKGYEWDVYGVTPKTRATTADEQAMGWPAQVPIYNSGKYPELRLDRCCNTFGCKPEPPAFAFFRK